MNTDPSHTLFIRHGQSAGNIIPGIIQGRSNHLELTPVGQQQAALVGPWLKNEYGTPDAIVASPAVRTRRTAEIALEAAGLQLDITLDDDLQEVSQGEWDGQPRKLMQAPNIQRRMRREGMDYKSPGGESLHDTQERMMAATLRLPEGTVWAFGHGLSERCLVGDLLDWTIDDILEASKRMYNTAVTDIQRTETGLHVARFAMAEHLPPELVTT